MRKFISDSKMFEYEKFHSECKKNNLPCVKARKNPADGNYLVQMDLITRENFFSPQKQIEVKCLFKTETKFLQENNLEKVFKGCNVNKEHVWYDGILPQRLENFCESLFELSSYSPLRKK